jgi:hypothetical protein
MLRAIGVSRRAIIETSVRIKTNGMYAAAAQFEGTNHTVDRFHETMWTYILYVIIA